MIAEKLNACDFFGRYQVGETHKTTTETIPHLFLIIIGMIESVWITYEINFIKMLCFRYKSENSLDLDHISALPLNPPGSVSIKNARFVRFRQCEYF